eukprot:UN09558
MILFQSSSRKFLALRKLNNITWQRPRMLPREPLCKSGSVPNTLKRYSQFEKTTIFRTIPTVLCRCI